MTNQLTPNFNQRLQNGLVPAIWSRERSELWHKGATSGHTQHVETMMLDCDADTLLIQVTPNGPACHTGATSCFFNPVPTKEAQAE